jgi:1-acyl-sn-glycerol-3-phosphate acyltransferase
VLERDPLVIFPQGTRSESYDNVKSGVGFLYKKAKVPIVAAKIYGTDKMLPKGSTRIKSGKVSVIFTKIDEINNNDSYEEIAVTIIKKIKVL